jgi:hypothetical protein
MLYLSQELFSFHWNESVIMNGDMGRITEEVAVVDVRVPWG